MGIESSPYPTYDIKAIRECFDQILEEVKELSVEIIKCEDMEDKCQFEDANKTLANITSELVDVVYTCVQMSNRLGLPFDKMFLGGFHDYFRG